MHSYRNGLKERHVIRIQSLLPQYMRTFIHYFSYPKEENRKWTAIKTLTLMGKATLVTISWKTVASLLSQCRDIFNWKTKTKIGSIQREKQSHTKRLHVATEKCHLCYFCSEHKNRTVGNTRKSKFQSKPFSRKIRNGILFSFPKKF